MFTRAFRGKQAESEWLDCVHEVSSDPSFRRYQRKAGPPCKTTGRLVFVTARS
jgi:hypothetical protein